MKAPRKIWVLALAALLAAVPAFAQTPAAVPPAPPADRAWSFFTSAYFFAVPDGDDYVQPLFTADRDRLHLEARYNYEGTKTGSVWAGYNLGGGQTITWELTPIVGGVFGETKGVAPGYKGSISWRALQAYSESEYVIDTSSTADSFLYNWSEFTVAPAEMFRVGLVIQRTRAYQTERDVQRGLIVGVSWKRAEFTLCVFNPDVDKPTVAWSMGWNF